MRHSIWQIGASPGYVVNMGSHRFSCDLALANFSCFINAVVKFVTQTFIIKKFIDSDLLIIDPDKQKF